MSRAPLDSVFHDDHDGFERPTGRSRPRTKDRPDHSRLPLGRVIAIDRGRYRCLVDAPPSSPTTPPDGRPAVSPSPWSATNGPAPSPTAPPPGDDSLSSPTTPPPADAAASLAPSSLSGAPAPSPRPFATGDTTPSPATPPATTADGGAPGDDSWGRRPVTAVKARSLGPQSVVVGDAVRLDGDVSGAEGSLARVAAVEPRRTVLRRMREDDPQERPLVANADQLVIVAALADPEPRLGLIDRALVAAYDGGLEPLLCLTKADLAPADDLLTAYGPLGLAVLVLRPGCDLAPLRRRLSRRCSVLLGHSGVGKSTLVNALIPGADRVIGAVNQVTGRGRHTSSSLLALALPGGGWIIDTPGVRSFGLSHVKPEHLLAAFADLAALARDCPRGCGHRAADPECALDQAVADGRLEAARLTSFRRLNLPGPL